MFGSRQVINENLKLVILVGGRISIRKVLMIYHSKFIAHSKDVQRDADVHPEIP